VPTKVTLKGQIIAMEKEVLVVTETVHDVMEKVNDALATPAQPHVMLHDSQGKAVTIDATLFLEAVEV
jgi:hypothetical protein